MNKYVYNLLILIFAILIFGRLIGQVNIASHIEAFIIIRNAEDNYGDFGNISLSRIPFYVISDASWKVLAFDLNNIHQIPDEFEKLQTLEKVYFDDNELSTLPPTIGNLKNLKVLTVAGNHLSDLPSEVVNLKNLAVLDISSNNFSSLPQSVKSLKNLRELKVFRNCDLVINIEDIANLQSLEVIDISNTAMTQSMADSIQASKPDIEVRFRGSSKCPP